MTISVKNWSKFQHFKDRSPPWIKLYRNILDDPQWHKLDANASKLLVMLWLLASENNGELPDVETIAFRLRVDPESVKASVSKLSHWLDGVVINVIPPCYHADTVAVQKKSATEVSVYQETERETEESRERTTVGKPTPCRFADFWNTWPSSSRKVAKAECEKRWKARRLDVHADAIIANIEILKQSDSWQRGFEPAPLTYLNQKRWEDEPQAEIQQHWNTV